MRVLHILNSNIYSGAENVVCTIMKNMRAGDECLYMSRDGDIRKKVEELGLEFYGVEKLSGNTIGAAVKKFRPDIIHAHDFTASITASGTFGGRLSSEDGTKIPVISHLHNNRPWMRKLNLRTMLYGATFNRYAIVLQVSDSVGKEYVFSKSQGKRMLTIGNPFSAESVRRMAYGGTDAGGAKKTDILFVGRLTEQKNLPCFIETVKLVREQWPGIRASIVGAGELKKLCRDLIKTAGVEDNISMEGYIENPYPWMANTKLLLMPSLYEGFGLVALEAMSLGIPVLARPVGGLAGIVTPECGALCDTAEEFAQEICELLNNEEKYINKSASARVRADEYDNVEDYMGRIYKVYERITLR